MNEEQVKSALRSLISAFGGVIAGFFAAKGWFTVDQVVSVLNSGTFIGATTSIIVGIWGLFVHTKTNAVIIVDAMPEVKGIVTKQTVAGRDLAAAVPSPTVVPAGTKGAADIAEVPAAGTASSIGGHP